MWFDLGSDASLVVGVVTVRVVTIFGSKVVFEIAFNVLTTVSLNAAPTKYNISFY